MLHRPPSIVRNAVLMCAVAVSIGWSSPTTISGTVTDSISNTGIASAKIWIYHRKTQITTNGSTSAYRILDTTRTTANGTYALSFDAPADSSFSAPGYSYQTDLLLDVEAERYGTPARSRVIHLPVATSIAVDFKLYQATFEQNDATFRGTVYDSAANAPLGGATVYLRSTKKVVNKYSGLQSSVSDEINYWTTDNSGTFAFRIPYPQGMDYYTLSAYKPGYAFSDTTIAEFLLKPAEVPKNIALRLVQRFAAIAGTVTDSITRTPLINTMVYLHERVYSNARPDSCIGYYRRDSLHTGADGTYRFDSLSTTRKYTIVARHYGYASDSAIVNAAASTYGNPDYSANIDLRPSLVTLSGVVVDNLSGRALAGAKVYRKGTTFRGSGVFLRMVDTLYDSTTTDLSGRYIFKDLSDTNYQFLTCCAAAYYESKPLDIPFDGTLNLTLTIPLVIRSGFYGYITDSLTGEPLSGTLVTLVHRVLTGNPPRFTTIYDDSLATASDGVFAFAVSVDEMSPGFSIQAKRVGYHTKSRGMFTVTDSSVADVSIALVNQTTSSAPSSLKTGNATFTHLGSKLHISTPGTAIATVFTANGKVISSRKFSRSLVLERTDFAATLHFVQIQDENGSRKTYTYLPW